MHFSFNPIYVSFFVSMMAITNPLGNLGIFLGLTQGQTAAEIRKLSLTIAISLFIALQATLWFGTGILHVFGISLPAFEVAGGLIILLIGLSLLNAKTSEIKHTDKELHHSKVKDNIAVVPMTIPFLCGPGTMSVVIIAAHHHSTMADMIRLSVICSLNALVVYACLYFAPVLSRILGELGVRIVGRLMGMILAAMAVGMMATGVQQFLG